MANTCTEGGQQACRHSGVSGLRCVVFFAAVRLGCMGVQVLLGQLWSFGLSLFANCCYSQLPLVHTPFKDPNYRPPLNIHEPQPQIRQHVGGGEGDFSKVGAHFGGFLPMYSPTRDVAWVPCGLKFMMQYDVVFPKRFQGPVHLIQYFGLRNI